jgi:hypothetical protein
MPRAPGHAQATSVQGSGSHCCSQDMLMEARLGGAHFKLRTPSPWACLGFASEASWMAGARDGLVGLLTNS